MRQRRHRTDFIVCDEIFDIVRIMLEYVSGKEAWLFCLSVLGGGVKGKGVWLTQCETHWNLTTVVTETRFRLMSFSILCFNAKQKFWHPLFFH